MHSNQSPTGVLDARSIVASPIVDSAEPLHVATIDVRRSRTLKDSASAVGQFLLHFLEMVIAMGVVGLLAYDDVNVLVAVTASGFCDVEFVALAGLPPGPAETVTLI